MDFICKFEMHPFTQVGCIVSIYGTQARLATPIKGNLQPYSKNSLDYRHWNTGVQRIWKTDKTKAGICRLSAKSRPYLCLKFHA